MNLPRAKICGITHLDDALAAVEFGADALGFIMYEKSPRYIAPMEAASIVAKLPPFISAVAVTVNAEALLTEAVEDQHHPLRRFHAWQLHGSESPALCTRLAGTMMLIKAVPAGKVTREEVAAWEQSGVSAFLLDTPSVKHGGTGETFDWAEFARFKEKTSRPLVLSGGLNSDNLANALEIMHPYSVDVCSGVELSPGRKDLAKMRRFLQICKRC